MSKSQSTTAEPWYAPSPPFAAPGHPMVVFDDHRFCAGADLEIIRMPAPHMHSQIELNYMLDGAMTYWFDGRELTLSAGRLGVFWGMVPHQSVGVEPGSRFVCLYIPVSVFLALPVSQKLRGALLGGAVLEARHVQPFERNVFLRWREELLTGDPRREQIVRDELGARIRRLDLDGWSDPREVFAAAPITAPIGRGWEVHVGHMARFIGEHGCEEITVADVAGVAALHPNYAMRLYKKALGMTINQAITRHRLDTAQALLISTDKDVADIAFDSGFGSLSRFYEAFQAHFGVSPVTLRRRYAASPRPQLMSAE